MSNSLRPHGLQHARLPYPSPTPRACSNSYPSSRWCHPTISSSFVPFSFCLQSYPASGFFSESFLHIRWPNYWSFSISPSSEYSGLISFTIDWFEKSNITVLRRSAFFIVQLSHPYRTTGKTIALTRWTFISKVMSLLFNMLSRLVIAFLPRSKCLLISWLQSPSAVILEPKKVSLSLFPLFPRLFIMKWWDRMPWSLFLNVEF